MRMSFSQLVRNGQLLLAVAILLFAAVRVSPQCSLTLADPAAGFPAGAQAQDVVKVAFRVDHQFI